VVDWSYGDGRIFYEFVFYPQWMYYVGREAMAKGYPVYHLAFNDDDRKPVRIGWLKRTLTGGVSIEEYSLSVAEAIERLRQLDWEFSGDQYIDGPVTATAAFSSRTARVEKLAYQIRLT